MMHDGPGLQRSYALNQLATQDHWTLLQMVQPFSHLDEARLDFRIAREVLNEFVEIYGEKLCLLMGCWGK